MDLGTVAIIGLVGAALRGVPAKLTRWLQSKTLASLTVKYGQEEYNQLEIWLQKQSGFACFDLKGGKLVADRGSYWFWYRGKLVVAGKDFVEAGNSVISWNKEDAFPEELTIKILFGRQADLSHILNEVRVEEEGVPIWMGEHGSWKFVGRREGRSLETVVMDPELPKDVERFLKSKDQYKAIGVPYRRGYLLYGPPGTGKTSAIVGLATEFGLSIHIIPSSAKDAQLQALMSSLPPKAIVIMEDVDKLFTQNKELSQSGLLNAIDGITDSDGRILVLTTNHKDTLDPALVREGRCDRHFEFSDPNPGRLLRAKLETK